jgi:SAM-dependent methyltransferase
VSGEYDASTYGERMAEVYDQWLRVPKNADAVVAFLAGLAGRGPVLELGIGTGRIALPLSQRGVELHGIDASPSMVAKLKAKPGGDRIRITIGDFATMPVEGRFSLVFVLAGLRLRERWGGWNREPFSAASASHVSVYRRPT